MKKIEIRDNGLVANLYTPELSDESTKYSAILLMSGSDGGMPGANAIPEYYIENLVANGFLVLALAYFGVEGVPNTLVNIDLQYFEKALIWLGSKPYVNSSNISIIGQSRGGELVLILGTIFPQYIKSIVAYVPSNVINGGFPYPNQPAWLYHGQPLTPFVHGITSNIESLTELDELNTLTQQNKIFFHNNTQEDPFMLSDLFKIRNEQLGRELAEIPVEKIQCPLLLVSGGQDNCWPCEYYCQQIMHRLEQNQSTIFRKHVNYDNAGHGIFASREGGIYHYIGGFWCKLGGSVEGNLTAKNESQNELLNFLLNK
jgi:pimeloyl-ACP methyl ester carboxylesterase